MRKRRLWSGSNKEGGKKISPKLKEDSQRDNYGVHTLHMTKAAKEERKRIKEWGESLKDKLGT